MSFFLSVFLFALTLLSQPSVHAHTTSGSQTVTPIVSLGEDCQVAWYARYHQLRHAAYPLDWITSYEFDGIMTSFEDNFEHFLDTNCLEHKNHFIYNNYYQLAFYHDFPTIYHGDVAHEEENSGIIVSNYLDYLDEVKAKYFVRIRRLQQLLESNGPVIFIRTHILPNQARRFVNLIKARYPQLQFLLVVVHQKPGIVDDWGIPNVRNFYAINRGGSHIEWWWNDAEWENIFRRLNLLYP